MSYLRWLRAAFGPNANGVDSPAPRFHPIAVWHTPQSVLARARSDAEFPYYVGKRARLATCGGAAWFHGSHLATINLLGNALHTLRFDARERTFTPLQTLAGLEGLARPENLAFSAAGDLLAVTNSLGGGVTLYGVDRESHTIGETPLAAIDRAEPVNPHGVSFSPCGRALLFSTVEHPGSLRCMRLSRRADGGLVLERLQTLVNPYAPLRPKGLAFSPDGRRVAVAYGANAEKRAHRTKAGFLAIYDFDIECGCFSRPRWTSGKGLGVGCAEDVSFLPDASAVVITDQANDSASVVSIDANTGAIGNTKHRLTNPDARISFPHGNGISADGRFLAITNYGNDTLTVYALDSTTRL